MELYGGLMGDWRLVGAVALLVEQCESCNLEVRRRLVIVKYGRRLLT